MKEYPTKANISFKDGNFIYRKDNHVIGSLNWKHESDDSYPRNILILWVEVSKEYKRQGIGSLLIKEFIKQQRKEHTHWISLWTSKEFEKNFNDFYVKNGFEECVYYKDYYRKGIGTRLYRMKLN